METHNRNTERLAQWIDRELRRLPPRSAPADLQSRVLAAIAQRAAPPWWKQHFLRWPLLARIGFLLASILVARLLLWLSTWLTQGWSDTVSAPARALRDDFTLVATLNDMLRVIVEAIPSPWLYGILGFVALLYVTLFGLGSVAYRAFYNPR